MFSFPYFIFSLPLYPRQLQGSLLWNFMVEKEENGEDVSVMKNKFPSDSIMMCFSFCAIINP